MIEAGIVPLNVLNMFDLIFLHKLNDPNTSGGISHLIQFFQSNFEMTVVLKCRLSRRYSCNARFPKGFLLGSTLFPIFIDDISAVNSSQLNIYSNTNIYSYLNSMSDGFDNVKLN